jgi:hypothetical protein
LAASHERLAVLREVKKELDEEFSEAFSRELWSPDTESAIQTLQQRVHERLAMLASVATTPVAVERGEPGR